MNGLRTRTRAMLLLKIACEAGARTQALDILGNGMSAVEDKEAVDWVRVHRELEALLKSVGAQGDYAAGCL